MKILTSLTVFFFLGFSAETQAMGSKPPAPKNSAPIVNAGADFSVEASSKDGTQSFQLNGSATDAQNNISTYKLYRNNTLIISSSNDVFKALQRLPAGSYSFRMEAIDSKGLKGSDEVVVTVKPFVPTVTNTSPVIIPGPAITVVDSDNNGSEIVKLSGSASDKENNISAYTIYLNGVAVISGTSPSTFSTPITVPVGKHTVILEARDSLGAIGRGTIIVTVNKPQAAVNTAPKVDAGSDMVVTDSDNSGSEMVSVSGSASDAENNIASFRILLNGVQVATSLSASFSVPLGQNTVIMEAKDSAGLVGSDSLIVTVNKGVVTPPPSGNNTPPKANAGADISMVMPTVAEEVYADDYSKLVIDGNGGVERMTFTGSASDAENNIVSYVWKMNGVVVQRSSSPSILTMNKINVIQGLNVLTLEVTDAGGLMASDSAFVELKPHIDSLSWSPGLTVTQRASTLSGRASLRGILQVSTGGSRDFIDKDNNGVENVRMVGSVNSKYPIAMYKWEMRGQVLAQGSTPDILTRSFDFPLGHNGIWLTVTDTMGNTVQDTSGISVTAPVVEQIAKVASGVAVDNYLNPEWDTGPSWWKDNSAFRFRCKPSHVSYDDPIVFPGQPGKAHLHTFFGNTLANANSTYVSLRTTGDGSCDGGPLNRSAYWMPSVLNAQGKVVLPDYLTIYYKRQPGTNPFPRGLKMVFGYDSRYPDKAGGNWLCDSGGTGSGPKITDITNCPATSLAGGGRIVSQLGALSCWDGKNLDSPDHRSHMAACDYSNGFGECQCPKTHPVDIPAFSMIAAYGHDGNSDFQNWKLSSDHVNMNDPNSARMPSGWTLHADWFGAWEDSVLDMWMEGCMNQFKSCSGGALGMGKQLKENPGFSWTTTPRLIDPPVKPMP